MARQVKLISRKLTDREHAGRLLGEKLRAYAGRDDVVVLAMSPGGVAVASAVARKLEAPLDVFLVRPVETPGHEELTLGVVASGGLRVLNREVVEGVGLESGVVENVLRQGWRALKREEALYRGERPRPETGARTVILVDDGVLRAGAMKEAVKAMRSSSPRQVVVAVPVGAEETCRVLKQEADEVVCGLMPHPFGVAASVHYTHFDEISRTEIRRMLDEGSRRGV